MKIKKGKKSKSKLQKKFLLLILVLFAVIAVSFSLDLHFYYSSVAESKYGESAYEEAVFVASGIDGDKVAEYAATLQKDDYYYKVQKEMKAAMHHIMQNTVLKYVYVIVPYQDHLLYIWDFPTDESLTGMDLGYVENYVGDGEEAALAAFNVKEGQSYNPFVTTDSPEYGKLVSAYVPIFDSNGDPQAVVGVDMDANYITSDIVFFLLIVIATMLILMLIIYLIFYFLIRRTIIQPINSLNDAAENFVDNQMEKGEPIRLDIRTGDEIENLASAFTHMSLKLNDYIVNLRKITAEKERVSAELNVATQIQADMLPSIFPPYPDRKDFDIFASMKPAKEVGGDLYDFFMVNDDLLAVVIADVSGKGVPAALFMVITKTLIKNHAQAGESPEQVFTCVNRQLCENDKSGLFVTGWMAYIRLSTGEVTYVNAGHNPPLIRKAKGTYEYLKCRPNCILAAFDDTEYKQETLVMEPGDVLYLYTDGVTEATNSEKELFGEDRLKQSLDARIGQRIEAILPEIKQDLDDFVKEAPQFDDITMLIFRRNATEEGKVRENTAKDRSAKENETGDGAVGESAAVENAAGESAAGENAAGKSAAGQ